MSRVVSAYGMPMLAGIVDRIFHRTGKSAVVPPRMAPPTDPIELFRFWVENAEAITVLTGAGLSATSGLHTYRGEDGRWNAERPVTHADFRGDEDARMRQWRRSLADGQSFDRAAPNEAHTLLARLAETRGAVIVTQNVDGLHRRAGTPETSLIEIHGRGDMAHCPSCGARSPLEAHRMSFDAGVSPRCEVDGTPLQPSVILFGEKPVDKVLRAAEAAARRCDLFIVVGSSLTVTPAAYLPLDAHHSGAKVVVVNKGAVKRDVKADLVFDGDAISVLSRVM